MDRHPETAHRALLAQYDPEIEAAIAGEETRERRGIELIPSENAEDVPLLFCACRRRSESERDAEGQAHPHAITNKVCGPPPRWRSPPSECRLGGLVRRRSHRPGRRTIPAEDVPLLFCACWRRSESERDPQIIECRSRRGRAQAWCARAVGLVDHVERGVRSANFLGVGLHLRLRFRLGGRCFLAFRLIRCKSGRRTH